MLLVFEDRLSDSPLVERVWHSHSVREGAFVSVAASNFEIAVTRLRGRTAVTLRGPETHATAAECEAGGEWMGIRFALGTFVPSLRPGAVRDRRDVTLPAASARSFWLNGSAWEYPTFENADTFVARLVRKGLIARDRVVEAALRGEPGSTSARTVQRHFLQATGITPGMARQIARARYATDLLRRGVSILDTVFEAGYFDQAHLARSLRRFIGQTPAEIARGDRQLSFLYKTAPLP